MVKEIKMATQTQLDKAHSEMKSDENDKSLRLGFYGRIIEAELLLFLEKEPTGADISPQSFAIEGGQFVTVFDTDERLVEFANDTAPYIAMSGRAIVGMLRGKGIGIGLNLGVAPSSFLMSSEAVDWLAGVLSNVPDPRMDQPAKIQAADSFPSELIETIGSSLKSASGLAGSAYLVQVSYLDGGSGYMVAVIEAQSQAQPAIGQSINDALVFSGAEIGNLDVGFFSETDPVFSQIKDVGTLIEIPRPAKRQKKQPAPGMDPDSPPRLR